MTGHSPAPAPQPGSARQPRGVRPQPAPGFRSLATKFAVFMAVVVLWVAVTLLGYDLRHGDAQLPKSLMLSAVVLLVAAAISRVTLRFLVRPLALLEAGIKSVGEGRLEPVQVSPTHDEIELLGHSFNRMISALAASKEEIRKHQELLEQRIRKRTEALEDAMHRAMAASQAKSEFLANMSHELRTPMSGILGMIDIVLDSPLRADQRDHLDTALRCAQSLLALLNDLLDLSKIEAGKMALEKIPFDLCRLVEDCAVSQTPWAREKGIAVTCRIDPAVPREVEGDPLRLRQIVTNLMSNAVKFTEAGRVELRLGGKPAGEDSFQLSLEVEDTGSGIPESKRAAIFEKFTQADGSITRKYGGTGLGLSITRKLVEIQGGRIWVESTVGRGSTFFVTLPVACASASLAASRLQADTGATALPIPQARILVVEDNLVNQKVVSAILRKKGMVIEVANHGQEALEMLESGGYSLILMDIQMPVLDGLETTRRIRRHPRYGDLPIIAMTAHAMNGDRERCLRAGMNAYISKPVDAGHLLTTVEAFLGAPRKASKPGATLAPTAGSGRLTDAPTELADSLLDLFLQLAPGRLDKMRAAAGTGDMAAIEREAALMRSAADRIGADSAAATAAELAEAGARSDRAAVSRHIETLATRIDRIAAPSPLVVTLRAAGARR